MNVTDPSVRLGTQSSAMRTGMLFHNLGAFLLELGRTTMTLRLGETPVGFSAFRVHAFFSLVTLTVLCFALANVLCSQKPLLTLDLQFS